jgi:hypothetical protein
MDMKAVGESLQSPTEIELLDSVSTRTLAVPEKKWWLERFSSLHKICNAGGDVTKIL